MDEEVDTVLDVAYRELFGDEVRDSFLRAFRFLILDIIEDIDEVKNVVCSMLR